MKTHLKTIGVFIVLIGLLTLNATVISIVSPTRSIPECIGFGFPFLILEIVGGVAMYLFYMFVYDIIKDIEDEKEI